MFKKLRNNFVLLNMIIISSIMMIAFAVIYFSMYQNTMQNLQNKLSAMPIGAPRVIGRGSDDEIFSGGVLPTDYSLSFNLILNKDGQLLKIHSYVDMPIDSYELAANKAFNSKKEYGKTKLYGRTWMYHIRSNNITSIINDQRINFNDNNYSVVFIDITDSISSLNNLLFIFIIVGVIMLFIIYIISVYFAKRSVKEIEEAWDKQKQFITDASHEFKTPIAVIEANTDALLLEKGNKNNKWIKYIKTETSRMNKLVTDLLYLAKTENMDIEFENISFNISEILNQVILSMEAIIYEKELILNQNIENDLIFRGDASKIEQVMIILIDNAIKYSDTSGSINISLNKINKTIEFIVENSGKGIDKGNLTKIFNRFYREDTARTGIDNSYGLGLSIAKASIERMNGKIFVESIPDKLTKFKIIFKIK